MTPANVRRVLLLLFVALVGLAVYAANHSENSTTSRKVTRIEAASPCLTYGPKSELCKESFEKAVLTITHPEACAILRKAGLEVVECAHARLRQERNRREERNLHARTALEAEGTDEPSHMNAPSVPHQQPKPGKPGGRHKGGHHGGGHHPPSSPEPSQSPPSVPSSPPASESSQPSEPGHSGETPAAEHAEGVKACVDVVVSACAEVPKLLP